MKAIAALLGIFIATTQTLAVPFIGEVLGGYGRNGYGGYGYGGYGLGGFGGYPGFGGYEVAEIVDPIIPVSGGLVGERSYVDSFIPGSSYGGFGTYGPAYGGLPYPLEAFAPVGYPELGIY